MPARKMHVDEVDIDVSLVRWLLTAQFPQWADLSIKQVKSAGTDNAIYQLGNDMSVRLPRIAGATGQVEKEHYWLPKLAPFLPLAVPLPLVMGEPGEGYPWHWSVYRWLEGENASMARIADPCQATMDLAHFTIALHQIDATNGPSARRGVPLIMQDAETRAAIADLHRQGVFDTDMATTATQAWEAALQASEWDLEPVWVHGDLLPGNLLVKGGRLSAVIDFAGLGVGDPACDLMIAWGLFSSESRDVFREVLGVDDATWARGRGWALSQALIFVPYYLDTNPVGVADAQRAIAEILADQAMS